MKKRLLLRLFLLIGLAIAGIVLIAWSTIPSNLTRIDIENIIAEIGGTDEAGVVEVLKAPGEETVLIEDPKGRKRSDIEVFDWGAYDARRRTLHLLERPHRWKEWQTPSGKRLAVGFDDADKVVLIATFEVQDTWLDKARRWLRMTP